MSEAENLEPASFTDPLTNWAHALANNGPHKVSDGEVILMDIVGKAGRRKYLYRATCSCGFWCEAYGKDRTQDQFEGHVKTMEWQFKQEKVRYGQP